MTTGILKYRLVELKYPINDPETPETRWYARAVQDRTIDFEDFVTHMSEHNSPYSRGVIHGVLIDMLSCLQELVLDGKSVRLGDLGLFSLGISGEGAPTRDVYNPTNYVKDVHLNVRNTNIPLLPCNLTTLLSSSASVEVLWGQMTVTFSPFFSKYFFSSKQSLAIPPLLGG